MGGKFFTVSVNPDMGADGATTALSTAFSAGDILFDWHAFDVPKGSSLLVQTVVLAAGTNGVDQTIYDVELFFAKSINGVAPITLGVNNAAVTGEGWYNNIIGRTYLDVSANYVGNDGNLVYMNVIQNQQHARNVVLEGEPDSGSNAGYSKMYVASIAKGAWDFNTGVLINMTDSDDLAALGTATLTVDGNDCRNSFAIGDVLTAQDGANVGTIESMTDANTIVLTSVHTDALTNNDELFHQSPMKFIFSFEQ